MNTSITPLLTRTALCIALAGAGLLPFAAQGQTRAAAPAAQKPAATVEVVAELPIRPGNVTATPQGRVFTTVHSLGAPSGLQLIEITNGQYKAWPSADVQSAEGQVAEDRLDTPLGVAQDGKGNLWVIDMGHHIGKTRIWGFDITTGALVRKIDLPAEIAPKGAFVQDLVIDAERGWAYLADLAPPGLIAVNLATGKAQRFAPHKSFDPEPEARMRIDGRDTMFNGQPANVGLNPITLSADGNTVFYGAMNGSRWYSVPARLLREGADMARVGAAIKQVGRKPVSDGAATDAAGNHYFTNTNEHGIDRLDTRGRLRPLVRDALLDWPDNVQVGPDGWFYISVNQLHKTPAFAGKDEGQPPYRIVRFKVPGLNPKPAR